VEDSEIVLKRKESYANTYKHPIQGVELFLLFKKNKKIF